MSRTTRRVIERHPAFTEQTEGATNSISEVSKPADSLEDASALLAEALAPRAADRQIRRASRTARLPAICRNQLGISAGGIACIPISGSRQRGTSAPGGGGDLPRAAPRQAGAAGRAGHVRAGQRRFHAGAMAISLQDTERPWHLLGVRRGGSARGRLPPQVQHGDRRVRGIRLPHGQVVCPQQGSDRSRRHTSREQLLALRLPGLRRHCKEAVGERCGARMVGALCPDSERSGRHPAHTRSAQPAGSRYPGGL